LTAWRSRDLAGDDHTVDVTRSAYEQPDRGALSTTSSGVTDGAMTGAADARLRWRMA
jgi:hypothetical protein